MTFFEFSTIRNAQIDLQIGLFSATAIHSSFCRSLSSIRDTADYTVNTTMEIVLSLRWLRLGLVAGLGLIMVTNCFLSFHTALQDDHHELIKSRLDDRRRQLAQQRHLQHVNETDESRRLAKLRRMHSKPVESTTTGKEQPHHENRDEEAANAQRKAKEEEATKESIIEKESQPKPKWKNWAHVVSPTMAPSHSQEEIARVIEKHRPIFDTAKEEALKELAKVDKDHPLVVAVHPRVKHHTTPPISSNATTSTAADVVATSAGDTKNSTNATSSVNGSKSDKNVTTPPSDLSGTPEKEEIQLKNVSMTSESEKESIAGTIKDEPSKTQKVNATISEAKGVSGNDTTKVQLNNKTETKSELKTNKPEKESIAATSKDKPSKGEQLNATKSEAKIVLTNETGAVQNQTKEAKDDSQALNVEDQKAQIASLKNVSSTASDSKPINKTETKSESKTNKPARESNEGTSKDESLKGEQLNATKMEAKEMSKKETNAVQNQTKETTNDSQTLKVEDEKAQIASLKNVSSTASELNTTSVASVNTTDSHHSSKTTKEDKFFKEVSDNLLHHRDPLQDVNKVDKQQEEKKEESPPKPGGDNHEQVAIIAAKNDTTIVHDGKHESGASKEDDFMKKVSDNLLHHRDPLQDVNNKDKTGQHEQKVVDTEVIPQNRTHDNSINATDNTNSNNQTISKSES